MRSGVKGREHVGLGSRAEVLAEEEVEVVGVVEERVRLTRGDLRARGDLSEPTHLRN